MKKAGLRLNIQKMKIMAAGPITSWQIEGEKVETVTYFIFLGYKITVDSGCSHEIKRHLLLGRKSMSNLDSVLKSRHITLPKNVLIVKAMFFCLFVCFFTSHIWMWKLDHKECWAPKNWCFQIVENTLESHLDCTEIKSVSPKGNHPKYSLEGLTLNLKL